MFELGRWGEGWYLRTEGDSPRLLDLMLILKMGLDRGVLGVVLVQGCLLVQFLEIESESILLNYLSLVGWVLR